MRGFIELTDKNDNGRTAVAIDSIRMISDEGGYCRIFFKGLSGHIFSDRGSVCFPTGGATVTESYDVIKKKILEAEAAA